MWDSCVIIYYLVSLVNSCIHKRLRVLMMNISAGKHGGSGNQPLVYLQESESFFLFVLGLGRGGEGGSGSF